MIVQKKWVDDAFVRYGDILAAEYHRASRGTLHRFSLRARLPGGVGYYRADGQAVERAFVRSPIKFASITSRYGLRRHPVLRYVRKHRGVDYGAPRGTAVWSVGHGTVRFAGRRGGYGRVVYVRHRNGLETRYAHLSRFARGVRRGARVTQKQVIGYVGKTGLATGPHLHFEVLRRGRHINPLSVVVPRAPPIPAREKARFHERVDPLVQQLSRTDIEADRGG